MLSQRPLRLIDTVVLEARKFNESLGRSQSRQIPLAWRIESKDTKHYSNEDASANEVDALASPQKALCENKWRSLNFKTKWTVKPQVYHMQRALFVVSKDTNWERKLVEAILILTNDSTLISFRVDHWKALPGITAVYNGPHIADAVVGAPK